MSTLKHLLKNHTQIHKTKPMKNYINYIIKYTLPICFILSGTLKALSIPAFEQEVLMYGEAYVGRWVSIFYKEIAIAVCSIEILLGVIALWRKFAFFTGIAFCLMLFFFVYLTGSNLFFPTIMGRLETCGCFGELIHFTPVSSFVKSAILACISIINLYISVKERKR